MLPICMVPLANLSSKSIVEEAIFVVPTPVLRLKAALLVAAIL